MKGRPESTAPSGTVWPVTIASGALIAQLVAGKATRDTLFLSHFGVALLPAAMIGAALVSFLAVAGVSRALTRFGPARVVPASFAVGGALFLGELWLSSYNESFTAVAVYLHTAVFFAASGSAFWSLVNERFDPQTAKAMVGRIAGGGTIGGILGGLLVWRASAHLSVPMMLALLAGINVIGLWGALRTVRQNAGVKDAIVTVSDNGMRVLRETPYLRDLAALVLAGSVIQALLDWLLSTHATDMFRDRQQELLGFFALFNMITSILSLAAQTALTRPILEKRGLDGTIKLQPASIAIGVVLAFVVPSHAAVIVLRGIEQVTRSSLYRSAYELFYTPLPTAKKRATKTLIDVGIDRIGTALGSAALLTIAHVASPVIQTRIVLVGVFAVTAASWIISTRLKGGYVAALEASMKSGAVALDDTETHDLTTKKTLAETTAFLNREKLLAGIEQLQRQQGVPHASGSTANASAQAPSSTRAPMSIDPRDVIVARAAALRSGDAMRIKRDLVTPLPPALAPLVVPLLANDLVVRDVVRALRRLAPRTTGMLLDHLLDTAVEPRVRRRIPRVLKVCRTQRAAQGLVAALRDPIFEVRVQVALALAQIGQESNITLDREEIFDVVIHEVTVGQGSWSKTGLTSIDEAAEEDLAPPPTSTRPEDGLHRGLAHVFTLLGLVLEREPLSIAYRALRSNDPGLRGTAFEYLEVVLPERVRNVLVPLLGDVKPSTKRRNPREIADELLKSGATLQRPRIS